MPLLFYLIKRLIKIIIMSQNNEKKNLDTKQ